MTDEERDKLIRETHAKVDKLHTAIYVGNGRKPVMSRLERLETYVSIAAVVASAACIGVVAVAIERIFG